MGRHSRASSALALVLGSTLALAFSAGVAAHRRDEYLQAARVALEADAVLIDLDLTPGIDMAGAVTTTIDRDRDGRLSSGEQNAYAREVVRALRITLDGEPLQLDLISSTFPELSSFQNGEGAIRLRTRASHPPLTAGSHRFSLRNPHMAGQSAYLANALVPDSDRITVRQQRRSVDQSELTIDYSVDGGSVAAWVFVGVPFAAVLMVRFARRPHG